MATEDDAKSVGAASTTAPKKTGSAKPGVETVVLGRAEKAALVAVVRDRLADAAFRRGFLATTAVARARTLLRSAVLKAGHAAHARCLDHSATLSDIVTRAAESLDDADRTKILAHWRTLAYRAKGSLKIVQRRRAQEAGIKKYDEDHAKKKRRKVKHQSRHY
eukprot:CAMPEP_0185708578 /NCGR_PEP_ID=MMETSP1164-20130828/26855_1 /TAXON_ID=1104430 /ORGANISM="Chrysoreinhardia sp, Strain CCMP2950" /LENGTH=162 /DNA_ID=CAMNT_0028376039 /DNA_START=249 /DNA_END=737 /DNA_ORIENTATION=-